MSNLTYVFLMACVCRFLKEGRKKKWIESERERKLKKERRTEEEE